MTHWCKNVTCSVKRKISDCMREEGLLHNHLRQWLIIIIMRQISRPAEGLRASHSPHLFLILPPPPSYVLRIAFSHLTHFVPFSRSATYSLCCLPFSSSRHINPTSCFFLLLPPFLSCSFLNWKSVCFFKKCSLSDMCDCRAEPWSLEWIKGNG